MVSPVAIGSQLRYGRLVRITGLIGEEKPNVGQQASSGIFAHETPLYVDGPRYKTRKPLANKVNEGYRYQ